MIIPYATLLLMDKKTAYVYLFTASARCSISVFSIRISLIKLRRTLSYWGTILGSVKLMFW